MASVLLEFGKNKEEAGHFLKGYLMRDLFFMSLLILCLTQLSVINYAFTMRLTGSNVYVNLAPKSQGGIV